MPIFFGLPHTTIHIPDSPDSVSRGMEIRRFREAGRPAEVLITAKIYCVVSDGVQKYAILEPPGDAVQDGHFFDVVALLEDVYRDSHPGKHLIDMRRWTTPSTENGWGKICVHVDTSTELTGLECSSLPWIARGTGVDPILERGATVRCLTELHRVDEPVAKDDASDDVFLWKVSWRVNARQICRIFQTKSLSERPSLAGVAQTCHHAVITENEPEACYAYSALMPLPVCESPYLLPDQDMGSNCLAPHFFDCILNSTALADDCTVRLRNSPRQRSVTPINDLMVPLAPTQVKTSRYFLKGPVHHMLPVPSEEDEGAKSPRTCYGHREVVGKLSRDQVNVLNSCGAFLRYWRTPMARWGIHCANLASRPASFLTEHTYFVYLTERTDAPRSGYRFAYQVDLAGMLANHQLPEFLANTANPELHDVLTERFRSLDTGPRTLRIVMGTSFMWNMYSVVVDAAFSDHAYNPHGGGLLGALMSRAVLTRVGGSCVDCRL
ncbi:hypothetical protein C8F01DRAFT_1087035 [Mycena amicta]|nr:hypothetical protein C8F01DRAFT_1087035 [Mycena amicta]